MRDGAREWNGVRKGDVVIGVVDVVVHVHVHALLVCARACAEKWPSLRQCCHQGAAHMASETVGAAIRRSVHVCFTGSLAGPRRAQRLWFPLAPLKTRSALATAGGFCSGARACDACRWCS
jgi:hypothetical protein